MAVTGEARKQRTRSDPGFDGDDDEETKQPFLFLVLQATNLLAGGARFSLSKIDQVFIGWGRERCIERRTEDGLRRLYISIDCPYISERHACLQRTPEGWVVSEEKPRNGIHIDGVRTSGNTVLDEGDVLTLGRSFFILGYEDTEDLSDFDARDISIAPPGLLTLLPSHAAAISDLRAVAGAKTSITLVGETGTGKELVARAIHALSGRSGPYVPINCAGLARDLIESELFGHVKGAFSGATRDQPGYIEVAHEGTLLLDEIPSAPRSLQADLLRIIQEQQVTPVGARFPRSVDVRFIAATQRPLEEAVERDGFRDDLRARLEGLTFQLLPLRERIPDMGIFLAHALREQGVTEADGLTITLPAALRLFLHDWPLNIRELAMAIDRARHLAKGSEIDRRHLPKWAIGDDDQRLKRTLMTDLRITRGNVTETARRLGRNRTLVYKWVKKYQIDLDELR